MKTLWKSEDRAIDKLLRTQARKSLRTDESCSGFDADLGNAYVERRLSRNQNSKYEHHLSFCPECRVRVAALARMAEPLALPDKDAARAGTLASIAAGLRVFSHPAWASAAVAILVLAVTFPLLVWRDAAQPSEMARSELKGPQELAGPRPAREDEPASSVGQQSAGTARYSSKSRSGGRRRDGQDTTPAGEGQRAQASPSGQPPSEAEAPKKSESALLARSADEEKAQPAPKPASPESRAAGTAKEPEKLDATGALKVPEEKGSATVVKLKPGIPSTERAQREPDATIRPKDSRPPQVAASGPARSPTAIAERSARHSLIEGDSARPDRPRTASPERKIGKKTFWLSRDTWVDKDYDPDKELPSVTVVRGSDVYRELLTKNNKLKGYLTGFSESERALIVFKSTVYQLIPQGATK
jgi:hypothetical protein